MKIIYAAMVACTLACALGNPAQARITRIAIDETVPMPAPANLAIPAYEQVAGRAFGELDPKLPGNAIIQDIGLARDADGKVRYVASFVIYKPVDMTKASGMIPFAKTADERKAANDPRPSLQERYVSHEGYVAAVAKATERGVAEGFLLQEDAAALISAADKSAVLR